MTAQELKALDGAPKAAAQASDDYTVQCNQPVAGKPLHKADLGGGRMEFGWYLVVAEQGSWVRHLAKREVVHCDLRRYTNQKSIPRLRLSDGTGWASEIGAITGDTLLAPFESDQEQFVYKVTAASIDVQKTVDLASEVTRHLPFDSTFELVDSSGWTSLNSRCTTEGVCGGILAVAFVGGESRKLRMELEMEMDNLRFEAEISAKSQHGFARWCERVCRGAMMPWRELAFQRKTGSRRQDCALWSMTLRHGSAAFRKWAGGAQAGRRLIRNLGVSKVHFRKRGLRKWREVVAKIVHSKGSAEQALVRRTNVVRVSAFVQIRKKSRQRSQGSQRLGVALARAKTAQSAAALDHLRAWASKGRIVKGWIKQLETSFIMRWLACWRTLNTQEGGTAAKMRAAVKRMLHCKLARAWSTWAAVVADQIQQQFRLRGALRRMLRRTVSAAWNTWRGQSDDAKAAEVKLKQAVKRMLNCKLATAWSTWVVTAAAKSEQETRVRGALQQMVTLALSRAWRIWQQLIANGMKLESKLKHAMKQMLHTKLATAWTTWVGVATCAQERQSKLQGALMRMLQRDMIGAWNAWRAQTFQVKQTEAMLKQAVAQMLRGKLAAAWRMWVAMAAGQSEQKTRMMDALQQMVKLALSRAWNAWRGQSADAGATEAKLKRAVERILNGKLAGAWSTWAVMVVNQLAQQGKVKSARMRMLRSALVRAWDTWVLEARLQRERGRKLKEHYFCSVKHALRRAWDFWLETLQHEKWSRGKLQKFLSRQKSKNLAAAFRTWCDWSSLCADQRWKITGFLIRLVKRRLVAAWGMWLDTTQRSKRNARKVRKFHIRTANQALGAAWQSWLEKHRRQLSARGMCARCVKRALLRAWNWWLQVIRHDKDIHAKVQSVLLQLRNLRLVAAWTLWRRYAVTRTKATALMSTLSGKRLLVVLLSWHDGARCNLNRQSKVSQGVAVSLTRKSRQACRLWFETAKFKHERLLSSFLISKAKRVQCTAWQFLVETSELKKTAHRKLEIYLLKLNAWRMVSTWHTLVAAKDWFREEHQKVARFQTRCLELSLRRLWILWITTGEHHRNVDNKVGAFLVGTKSRKLQEARNTWSQMAKHTNLSNAKVTKMLSMSLKRLLVSMWTAWRAEAKRRRGLDHKVLRVCSRLNTIKQRSAQQAWCAKHRHARECEHASKLLVSRKAKRDRKTAVIRWRETRIFRGSNHGEQVGKFVLRCSTARLADGYLFWRSKLGCKRRRIAAVAHMLQKWTRSAWISWGGFALESKLAQGRASRALARVEQVHVAQSFDVLRDRQVARRNTTRVIFKHIISIYFHTWCFVLQTLKELSVEGDKRKWRALHAFNWVSRWRQKRALQGMHSTAADGHHRKHSVRLAVVHSQKAVLRFWLVSKQETTWRMSNLGVGVRTCLRKYLRSFSHSARARKTAAFGVQRALKAHQKSTARACFSLLGQEREKGRQTEIKRDAVALWVEAGEAASTSLAEGFSVLATATAARNLQLAGIAKAIVQARRSKRARGFRWLRATQTRHHEAVARTSIAVKHALAHQKQLGISGWQAWLRRQSSGQETSQKGLDWLLRGIRRKTLSHLVLMFRSVSRQRRAAPIGTKHCLACTMRLMRRWTRKEVRRDRRTTHQALRKALYFDRCHQALGFWFWNELSNFWVDADVREKAAVGFIKNRRRAIGFWEWRANAAYSRFDDAQLTLTY